VAAADGAAAFARALEGDAPAAEGRGDVVGEVVAAALAAALAARDLEVRRRGVDHHVLHASCAGDGVVATVLDQIEPQRGDLGDQLLQAWCRVLPLPAVASRVSLFHGVVLVVLRVAERWGAMNRPRARAGRAEAV